MSVPPTGATLAGKYVLHRRLGAGGYGAVYEGENLDLGKRVAIKLIARRHAQSEEAMGRFRREARASARIESANIVQVFDVGDDPTFGLYMVMELLRGEDLRRKLDRAGKLPVEFAVDVAHQIACGLAKAHAAGVVHRDLKPANIFLHQPSAEADEIDSERVVVKIVDFGVAKLLDDAALGEAPSSQPLTTAGKTVGTPQYMSPEQVQGHPFDHRGDLWSLGGLLYEMLTGKPAFPLRDTFQETALAIVHEQPAPLVGVPPGLVEVVERALAKDPESRFADATSFAEALMRAVPSAFEDERAAARVAEIVAVHPRRTSVPSHPGVTSDPPTTAPVDRRRAGAIVAVAVLAVAAAILVLAAARNARVPSEATPAAPATTVTITSTKLLELPLEETPSASAATPASVSATPPATASATASAPRPAPTAAPTAKATTSSVAAPPPHKEPDQFGGTGVSSSF